MPVTFRKAAASDIDAVTAIYDAIIAEEEAGRAATGWKRGIYPVRAPRRRPRSRAAISSLRKRTDASRRPLF